MSMAVLILLLIVGLISYNGGKKSVEDEFQDKYMEEYVRGCWKGCNLMTFSVLNGASDDKIYYKYPECGGLCENFN